jgi:hypothetical protein
VRILRKLLLEDIAEDRQRKILKIEVKPEGRRNSLPEKQREVNNT